MNLDFKTPKLKKSLTEARELQKVFGTIAKKLAQRMQQLEAAPNLAVLISYPSANCHPLKGDRKGEWAVDISGNYRLIFEINQDPVPKKDDGSVNTILVTDIRILETTDYH
jgi:plasmid maintenance system killer protein